VICCQSNSVHSHRPRSWRVPGHSRCAARGRPGRKKKKERKIGCPISPSSACAPLKKVRPPVMNEEVMGHGRVGPPRWPSFLPRFSWMIFVTRIEKMPKLAPPAVEAFESCCTRPSKRRTDQCPGVPQRKGSNGATVLRCVGAEMRLKNVGGQSWAAEPFFPAGSSRLKKAAAGQGLPALQERDPTRDVPPASCLSTAAR